MSIGDENFTKRKERKKMVRTILEIILLVILAAGIINLFFTFKTYKPAADVSQTGEDTGFVALSYFGVERIGDTSTLIGNELLRQHLQVLKDQGYETVSQQDIMDYYEHGRQLPPKALFLMFEDGRRDTAVFAQDILEDLNYKATMMTYPEKFDNKDPKFLMPKELRDMEDSTFWEMGTNGYRLKFINVFDRYDNFIGEVTPLEYAMISPYLGRKYNHYLMDFIRDKHGMPKESVRHMDSRISYDYEKLKEIYTKELGYVPKTYVLMHANTGRFGNSPKVSAVNERWIRQLFKLNFNREGYCFNQRNVNPLDLTRMQPQPYWPVNHLLMRIKYDINQPIDFWGGDKRLLPDWDIQDGAAESKTEQLILTSQPAGWGIARLQRQNLTDSHVQMVLKGNAFGAQRLALRASEDLQTYIAIELYNGCLVVTEKNQGTSKELYKEKISILDGEAPISVPEDKQAAEIRELEALARYADSSEQAKLYTSTLRQKQSETVPSVADGAPAYEGRESFHKRQERTLAVSLQGNQLKLSLDGKELPEAVTVDVQHSGGIYLMAGWDENAWSQRNLADDVYDGVFEKINVWEITGPSAEQEQLIYTSELSGWEKKLLELQEYWEAILNFFLKNL